MPDAHLDGKPLSGLPMVDGQGDEPHGALGDPRMCRAIVAPEHDVVVVIDDLEL
jgi:hypothetical protein